MTPDTTPTSVESLTEALDISQRKNAEQARIIAELKSINAEQLSRLVNQTLLQAHATSLEASLIKAGK